MSDNWKTDGNCRECRRQDYCSKPCTALKRAIENHYRMPFKEIFNLAKFVRGENMTHAEGKTDRQS